MKARLDELTVMRAVACLSVLLVHISAIPFDSPDLSEGSLIFFGYLNRAFKFTTPTFVFLSGVMQYYHQWQGVFDFKKFMKKRFGPIFWPYLTAVIGYEVILGFMGVYPLSIKDCLTRFFLGSSNYHLYFVVIILQLYLLMPLVLKLFERFNDRLVLLGSLGINLISREFLIMPYSDRLFVNYLFFFMLGAYVVRHMDWFKEVASKRWGILLLGYLALSGIYGYQFVEGTISERYINYHLTSLTWFVFTLFAMALLYALSVKSVNWQGYGRFIKGFTQKISTASYWIYLIHPMFLYVSARAFSYTGLNSSALGFVWNSFWVFSSMLVFAHVYPNLLKIYKAGKEKMMR